MIEQEAQNKLLRHYAAHIAQKIRALRLDQHLTIQELAYRCDRERPNVSRLEAGNGNPTLKTLVSIAQALGIPPQELFE